jgi:aminobenzoyl-glutamate transport protein
MAVTILLSGILDLFDVSVNYSKINPKTGAVETTLVTIESLLNLSGVKYIFSNTVSNFVSFAPLSMLLILLMGISMMDESGFLDTLFFLVTRKMPKYLVTFIVSVLCIAVSITGDISFIIMIPFAALLFKYGKRNPVIGIVHAFACTGLGTGIHAIISSVDSALLSTTTQSANLISTSYTIGSWSTVWIMLLAFVAGSIILTYVTEKITAPALAKYEVDENEIIEDKDYLTNREKRGLLFAFIGATIYMIIFIYNIIPGLPFGGNLLDYSQARYIDKLFGAQSFFNSGFVFVVTLLFFICGLLYGIGAKKISNHRELCNFLSHSLDDIGKIIVLLFFASTFISIIKYTNIGEVFTAFLANVVNYSGFTGIPLMLLVFFIGALSTLVLPSAVTRWQILSASVVPSMMTAGFTPEAAQLVFTAGSSLTYILTPIMAYYVIYISYIEKYNKEGTGIRKGNSYLLPYSIGITAMWIILLLLFYVVKIHIGVHTAMII